MWNQRIVSILSEEQKQKLVKQSTIFAKQPKIIENPNIVDIKSSIKEHQKTYHKLSKTIKQVNGFPKQVVLIALYIVKQKKIIFFNEKK